MSDSFATAPRLDSTTLTLRIYPKPPTDHPLVLSPTPSLLFPFLRRHPLLPLVHSHPTSANHPPPLLHPPACLPACGACFPIPHSTVVIVVVVVAKTLREKVTSRSRISQDPANPSWYKIAPSGSQCHRRCHHRSRRNAPEREMFGKLGFRGSVRFDIVDCGGCSWLTDITRLCAATQRRSTNASRVGKTPTIEAR